MSTSNPNPFSSPASQPQPSVADQYPMSGVDIMQNNFTGPRAALSAYRNGTARGGNLAKPMAVGGMQTGAIASGPQTMQASMPATGANVSGPQTMQASPSRTGPQNALHGYLADLANSGGPTMGGIGQRNGSGAMGGGTFAGTNALGLGPGRVRSPGVMRPTQTRY